MRFVILKVKNLLLCTVSRGPLYVTAHSPRSWNWPTCLNKPCWSLTKQLPKYFLRHTVRYICVCVTYSNIVLLSPSTYAVYISTYLVSLFRSINNTFMILHRCLSLWQNKPWKLHWDWLFTLPNFLVSKKPRPGPPSSPPDNRTTGHPDTWIPRHTDTWNSGHLEPLTPGNHPHHCGN